MEGSSHEMPYFAYGSNMNHTQMRTRCPGSRFIGRAYLEDYAFVYDGYSPRRNCAVGNIVISAGERAWGGLYSITRDDLAALDGFENYPNSYQRKNVTVRDDNGNVHHAIVYFRAGKKPGKPSKAYRKVIVDGSRDCGLPQEYIEKYL